jgi:hypothetical protein
MKKALLVYLIFFSVLKTIAQIQSPVQSQVQSLFQEIQPNGIWNFSQLNNGGSLINGSQYLEEKFLLSRISSVQNSLYEARYNVFKDEMEVKDKDNLLILNKFDSLTVFFTATNKTYECKKFNYKNKEHIGFLNKLTKNKNVNLYSKEVITFVPKKIASNSYNSDIDAHFKKDSNVYFIQVGNSIIEMPTKKK